MELSKGTCCKKAEPWDIMSGKGDGMIKKRRTLRRSGIRHITEIPVEERALYIEKRKQPPQCSGGCKSVVHVVQALLLIVTNRQLPQKSR